jgi:hypothetical protein
MQRIKRINDIPTISPQSNKYIRVYSLSMFVVTDQINAVIVYRIDNIPCLEIYLNNEKFMVEFHTEKERNDEFYLLIDIIAQRKGSIDTFFSKGQGYKTLSGKLNPDVTDKIMEYL